MVVGPEELFVGVSRMRSVLTKELTFTGRNYQDHRRHRPVLRCAKMLLEVFLRVLWGGHHFRPHP